MPELEETDSLSKPEIPRDPMQPSEIKTIRVVRGERGKVYVPIGFREKPVTSLDAYNNAGLIRVQELPKGQKIDLEA